MTNADRIKNMRYIEDVVNGLVPSDRHFNTIYALLGKHGLSSLTFEKVNADSIADCAASIARVRMCD
jgi:hypothetical protein